MLKIYSHIPPLKGLGMDAFETYIRPLLPETYQMDRYKKTPIYVAVALCGIYLLVDKIIKPPRSLRHLPRGNSFQMNKAYFQKINADYARDMTLPLVAQSPHGMYLNRETIGWSIHIAGPEAGRQLLREPDLFPKIGSNIAGKTLQSHIGDNNIVFLNGAGWKSHRKVMNPAFHRSMPVNLFGRLMIKFFNSIDKSLDHETVNIENMVTRWAFDVIGLAGFGFDFEAIENPTSEWFVRYSKTFAHIFDVFFLIFPVFDTKLLSLFPSRKEAHQELQKFMEKFDEIIVNKHKALKHESRSSSNTSDQEKDLLTLMIESGLDGKHPMTHEELRGNIAAFIIAGHESSSISLTMTIYHLAVNQDIQKKVRQEVLEVLGDTDSDVLPTVEQTRQMVYLEMILKETLRINPSLSVISPRVAAQDAELVGTFIPKGTPIFMDVYDLHHNPSVWKDPDTFNPDRFAPGGEAEQVEAGGWIPFGNGSRKCIGMNFSMAEQRVFLSMFLRKYEWQLPCNSIHKDKVITVGRVLPNPKNLEVILKRRY